MLWSLLFFLIPVVLVAVYSVGVLTLISYDQYLSLQPWRDFLHSSTYLGSPLGRGLFWKSMKMSLGVSITCVILAYPVAYMLALVAGRRKYTLLLVIITPFLTSYLLRVLAWRVLLNPAGRDPGWAPQRAGFHGEQNQVPWMYNSIVRGVPGAGLRVGAVRGAADLRVAREPRPADARGLERPGREPVDDVPARSRCRCRCRA